MVATITNPLRVGLRQERVIAPQCLVIFGASGDLTHRKLVPALFELFKQRRLPSEFALLGCARRPWTDEVFRGKMAEALAPRIAENPAAWEQFVSKLFYEPGKKNLSRAKEKQLTQRKIEIAPKAIYQHTANFLTKT